MQVVTFLLSEVLFNFSYFRFFVAILETEVGGNVVVDRQTGACIWSAANVFSELFSDSFSHFKSLDSI